MRVTPTKRPKLSLLAPALAFLAAGPAAAADPSTYTTFRDVEFARVDNISLHMDVYVPDGPGPYPGIVWIHGGGWSAGDKSLAPASSRVRQATRGYVVASIEYRLSGQATFPAQIYDCKAALRWLRANAARYKLNPDRIGVWGGSAGGHLVALVGTSGAVAELEGTVGGNTAYSSRAQAVVDWYGPSDLLTLDSQAPACSVITPGPNAPHSRLLGCVPSACPEKATSASPVAHVTADDPPFYIAHGTNDCTVPPAQSQELYDALVRAGVTAALKMFQGAGHGGAVFDDASNLPEIEAFLDRTLKAAAPARSVWIVPSAARSSGAGDAFYTTDLTLANTGPADATFTLKFLGNGVDGRTGAERTFSLGAGRSVTYADLLGSVFGLTSGFGAVRVTSTSGALVVLAQTGTPGGGGSYGQCVPAFASGDLIATGTVRSLAAVREDDAFRTNLVLANATEAALDVDVTLLDEGGAPLGAKRYAVLPLGMVQVTKVVRDLGVVAGVRLARLVLSTPTPSGFFAAYAALIDNASNDPRTVLPR